MGCSSKCMDLAMRISGGFARGLVLSGAAARARLPQPYGTPCCEIIVCSGQLAKLCDS